MHNDANAIAFGQRLTDPLQAEYYLKTFLETPFEGGRHEIRVKKIETGELAPMRSAGEPRGLALETGVQLHAEGSCLVRLGDTHVLCSASLEERVPDWMRGKGQRLDHRGIRHAAAEHPHPQRRGRRPRAGSRGAPWRSSASSGGACARRWTWAPWGRCQVTLDCDVLNADGGTRCASITGAWVALALALRARGLERAPWSPGGGGERGHPGRLPGPAPRA